MSEKLNMIKVLESLAIGVGSTENKSPRVYTAVLNFGMFKRAGKATICQIFKCWVMTKEITYTFPGLYFAKRTERNYLKQPVFGRTILGVITHVTNHVLTDSVRRPKHITKLVLLQNRIICPGSWLASSTFHKGLLPF